MITMDEQDKLYVLQMDSWLTEQEARAKEMTTTIETSGIIVEQNKLQLGWLLERIAKAVVEYSGWKEEKAKAKD